MNDNATHNGADLPTDNTAERFYVFPNEDSPMLIRAVAIVMPGSAERPGPPDDVGPGTVIDKFVLNAMPPDDTVRRLERCMNNKTLHAVPPVNVAHVVFQVIDEATFGTPWRIGDLDLFKNERPTLMPFEDYRNQEAPMADLASLAFGHLVTMAYHSGYKLALWPPPTGPCELYAVPMTTDEDKLKPLSLLEEIAAWLFCDFIPPSSPGQPWVFRKGGEQLISILFVIPTVFHP